MLARIRKAKEENEGGFTLIELLVVVVIIGILAAIAIPTFLNQREKAWTREAQSDLRNASVKMEEQFSETGSYPAAGYTSFKESAGVTSITVKSSSAAGYCIDLVHSKLTGANGTDNSKNWRLDSTLGRPEPSPCP